MVIRCSLSLNVLLLGFGRGRWLRAAVLNGVRVALRRIGGVLFRDGASPIREDDALLLLHASTTT